MSFDGAGNLSHRYLWGPAVDQLLADEQVHDLFNAANNETLWALTDHLGSLGDIVDSNGKKRIHRKFDAFGNITSETHYNASGAVVTAGQAGYVDEAFAFTGRYFDKDTGLQNNLNRWYDPSVGRWMSEDPIGFAAGDANLYRYVGNSPTISVDYLGLEGESDSEPNGPDFDFIKNDVAYRRGYFDQFGWHKTFCMSCHDPSNPNSVRKMAIARNTLDQSWVYFWMSQVAYGLAAQIAFESLAAMLPARLAAVPNRLTTPSGGQLQRGATLYRGHGGHADEFGSFWTTVDPTGVPPL